MKILLFTFILLLDQYTKHLAAQSLQLGMPQEIIPGLFNLTLVYNPGAAFGMFSTLPDTARRTVLGVVSVLALLVVLRFMTKEAKHDAVSQYALVGVLSGAVGNLIDRYRYDSVVDFLDFYWGTYHWPAFNVADSSICIGVAILIIRTTFFPKTNVAE